MEPNPETNTLPNSDRTQANLGRDESNLDLGLIRLALEASDRDVGMHSAVNVAKEADCSDTAVRKAFKAIKQHIPESLLMKNSKYTDLGKNLCLQYFARPKGVNGAQWVNALAEALASMPESVISEPVEANPKGFWDEVKSSYQQESNALVLSSQSMLSQIRQMNDEDFLGGDEAFDAELQAIRDREYKRQLQREFAAAQGRQTARQHVNGG